MRLSKVKQERLLGMVTQQAQFWPCAPKDFHVDVYKLRNRMTEPEGSYPTVGVYEMVLLPPRPEYEMALIIHYDGEIYEHKTEVTPEFARSFIDAAHRSTASGVHRL